MLIRCFLDLIMLFNSVLLISLMAGLASGTDHDTSLWNTDAHLGDRISTVTIDEMSMTKLKKDFQVTGKDQTIKVSFYNLWTATTKKVMNPGKLVRITTMVLCWIPQANNVKGKITLLLVDNRKNKDDSSRIESQVTFKPDRPMIGIFYHNYAMNIADLKYMDLELITHGVNVEKGTLGRLSFGYKTLITGARYYQKKNPELFYLPVEQLPELSVESPEDIYYQFVKKLKNKKQKEIDYFTKMRTFIDMSRTPINELTTNKIQALEDLNRDLQILEQYEKDAQKYKVEENKVRELKTAISEVRSRIELYTQDNAEEIIVKVNSPKVIDL
nr:movement protein [Callicarpa mosaic-associated virus 2]